MSKDSSIDRRILLRSLRRPGEGKFTIPYLWPRSTGSSKTAERSSIARQQRSLWRSSRLLGPFSCTAGLDRPLTHQTFLPKGCGPYLRPIMQPRVAHHMEITKLWQNRLSKLSSSCLAAVARIHLPRPSMISVRTTWNNKATASRAAHYHQEATVRCVSVGLDVAMTRWLLLWPSGAGAQPNHAIVIAMCIHGIRILGTA